MLLIEVLWILLILWGVQYNRACDNKPFSAQNSIALRGICAVEIMIGHLGLPGATNSIFLYPNRKAGILFVGVFFALSGYGLMYSVQNKKDYMQRFLQKRIFKILIPAYFIYAIGILIQRFISFESISFAHIFDMRTFYQSTNWYVWELILLYVVFYCCFKWLKSPWNTIGLYIFLTVFIVVAFIFKIDNPWYGSTLCFGLGVLYCQRNSAEICRNIKVSEYGCIFVLGGVVALSIGLFFLLGEQSILGNLVARNTASLAFVLMVIGLLYRFRIGNTVSAFLGKCSYEIFLFHQTYINILRPCIEDNLMYSVAVIFCSIASAYIFQKLWTQAEKHIAGRNLFSKS